MHLFTKLPLLLSITAGTALLSACGLIQPYTVTLNNNVIYTPVTARTEDTVLADASLQGCLNHTIAEDEIDTLEEVTLLACPNAGVTSLAGIGALPNLSRLDLSGNNISDLSPLVELSNLRILNLANNQVRSTSTLNNLPLLSFINLAGNDELPCRQLNRLKQRLGESLRGPLHCEQS